MKTNGRQLSIPLILLIITAVTSIISFIIYETKTEQYSTWQPVEGIFLKSERHRKGLKVDFCYQYSVNGQNYTGSTTYGSSSNSNRPEKGTVITVWYDPSAPHSSSYHKPNAILESAIPFVFAIPLSVAILLGTYNRRKEDGMNRNYTYREI